MSGKKPSTTPMGRAIAEIGGFFGTFDKGGVYKLLEGLSTPGEIPDFQAVEASSTESTFMEMLYDCSVGGMLIHKIIEDIATEFVAEGKIKETAVEKMAELFCITYDAEKAAGDLKGIFNGPDGKGAWQKEQGLGVNSENPDEGLKTAEDAKLVSCLYPGVDHEGKPSQTQINSSVKTPSKDKPNVVAIQILDPAVGIRTRDTGGLNVFMNAMPTLEMSRAVPFIDIRLFEMQHDDADIETYPGISLGRFLYGTSKMTGDDKEIFSNESVDDVAMLDLLRAKTIEAGGRNEDGTLKLTTATAPPTRSSGMELFTAPQTLVNADEEYSEESPNRATGVLDKFRPFMSLESVSITAAPSVGTFVFTSGKINLICHDRSRLSEVAGFVTPELFRDQYITLEYGWSHPDYPIDNPGLIGLDRNPFGAFIGSLRSKENYMVVNSSFSFDEVGQVKIELTIVAMGNTEVNNTAISLGAGVSEDMKLMRGLTKKISELVSKLESALPKSTETNPFEMLAAAGSVDGALTLDFETRNKILAFMRKRTPKGSPELAELKEALGDLFGTNGNDIVTARTYSGDFTRTKHNKAKGPSGTLVKFVKSRNSFIINQANSLFDTKFPDPFIRNFQMVPGQNVIARMDTKEKKKSKRVTREYRSRQYVSFGKMFLNFVAAPLAKSNKFDEIQVFFGQFNEQAAGMFDHNIAQFPIDKQDLMSVITQLAENSAQMSITAFVNFVNTYFMQDQGGVAFGLGMLYGARDPKDLTIRKAMKKGANKNPTILRDKTVKALKTIYGEEQEATFNPPNLQVLIETVNGRMDPNDKEKKAPPVILRIYVYDSVAKIYEHVHEILQTTVAQRANLIRLKKIDVKKQINNKRSAKMRENFLKAASKDKMLKPLEPKGNVGKADVASFPDKYLVNQTSKFNLKKLISHNVPTVTYGSAASGIVSAELSSQSDGLMARIQMEKAPKKGGALDDFYDEVGFPRQISPVEVSLKTIGCPLWRMMQTIFVDFGTGTTADGLYRVTEVSHNISPGEYNTDVRLVNANVHGSIKTSYEMVSDAIKELSKID